MPVTKASIRGHRKSVTNHARNVYFKKKVADAFKIFAKLVAGGQKDEAQKELPKVYSLLDRAAKKNIIHANKSARKKSQAAALLK